MESKKLYIREWLQFRGKQQSDLVEAQHINKSQVSKLVNGVLKRSPYPATLRKIADFLEVNIEDLWRNPFEIKRASRTVEVVDLEDWLNDPFATIDGKPATPEFKAWLRATLEQMVKK